jgi:hypothetical protein
MGQRASHEAAARCEANELRSDARNITQAGLAPFYSVAVKSMSVSWKAFFYGAFDPKATITIDKLAGSFLPQALSARIFGFHPCV